MTGEGYPPSESNPAPDPRPLPNPPYSPRFPPGNPSLGAGASVPRGPSCPPCLHSKA